MESERRRLQSILRRIGLTQKEAEVYIAIAVRGSATVKELLETLESVHQPQLYNILSSLIRKGFIRASVGRPKVYAANDLASLFDTRVHVIKNLKAEAVELLDKLKAVEKEVEGEALVYLIRGYEGLEAAILEVLGSAQVEVCAELPTRVLTEIIDAVENTLSRRVNMYLIVFPDVPEEVRENLSRYATLKLRKNRLGNFLMVTSDTRVTVYARRRFYSPYKLPVPETEVYGFYITEKDLIWRLLNIFEGGWKTADEVLSWPLSPESYPKTFLEFGMALNELEALLSKGLKPRVHVDGWYVKTREPVSVKGEVVRVERTVEVNNFTLDVGGEELAIGGFDSEVEDIEAYRVRIERVE